ncbi:hypothetical protein, partial [Thalassospira lucentensis]|uniref:hypothetical protein n=1 Tax=Thalassospira lucentensis TaxID=168935 RepID=UPI0023F69A32
VCGAVYISGGALWQGLFCKKMNLAGPVPEFRGNISLFQCVMGQACVANLYIFEGQIAWIKEAIAGDEKPRSTICDVVLNARRGIWCGR